MRDVGTAKAVGDEGSTGAARPVVAVGDEGSAERLPRTQTGGIEESSSKSF